MSANAREAIINTHYGYSSYSDVSDVFNNVIQFANSSINFSFFNFYNQQEILSYSFLSPHLTKSLT